MSSIRCYCDSPISDSLVEISGPEAHHMTNVLRLTPGDKVDLFDGSGNEFEAEIVQISRGLVNLNILGKRDVSRELSRKITIATAIPKSSRQKWLVEKLQEIGVYELRPLATRRSVVDLDTKGIDRLRRHAIEAAKQCGRNQLLRIGPMIEVSQLFSAPHKDRLRFIADPTGGREIAEDLSIDAGGVIVCIGPEGGWTDEEMLLAQQHGWQTLSLGPAVMRIETAALLAAARFRSWSE